MLQEIRSKSQGFFGKLIMGLIILTLSLFGFGALASFFQNEPIVAVVNGEDITESQFRSQLEYYRRAIESRSNGQDLPDDATIAEIALNSLVERILIDQEVNDLKLNMSDAQIDKIIVDTEIFQTNQVFDPELFKTILQTERLTPDSYRNALKQDNLRKDLLKGLLNSNFLTDWELKKLIRLQNEERSIAWLMFENKPLSKEDTEISDAEVATYYAENQDYFITSKQVSVNYIELAKKNFYSSEEINEDAILQLYQQTKDSYTQNESREASHILLKTDATQKEPDILKKIQELKLKIESGESFSELAKVHSQDSGSAKNGGSLGAAAKGVYVPEFEQALWELQKLGEVSQPVKTTYGYHIIKLEKIIPARVPELAELKADLLAQLKEQNASARYNEARLKLTQISYEAEDLTEPAQVLGLTIKKSEAFGISGTSSGLFSNKQLIEAAFSDDVIDGYNSTLLEYEQDNVVVLHIADVQKVRQQQLDEVTDNISKILANKLIDSQTQQRANEAYSDFLGGASSSAIATNYGLQWQRNESLKRDASNDLPQAVSSKAFELPTPPLDTRHSSALVELDSGIALVVLNNIKPGDINNLSSSDINAIKLANENFFRESSMASFRKSLLAKADIDK